MTRFSVIGIFFLVVVSACISADLPPRPVSFGDLIERPNAWNKERIKVVGYYVFDREHKDGCIRASSVADNSARQTEIYIDLPSKIGIRGATTFSNHWVCVSGVFEHRDTRSKVIDTRKDANGLTAVIRESSLGFGWGGIHSKQITDIVDLHRVGQ